MYLSETHTRINRKQQSLTRHRRPPCVRQLVRKYLGAAAGVCLFVSICMLLGGIKKENEQKRKQKADVVDSPLLSTDAENPASSIAAGWEGRQFDKTLSIHNATKIVLEGRDNHDERSGKKSSFPPGCRWECYISKYPDLFKKKFTKKDALQHYNKFGIKERRSCSCDQHTHATTCLFLFTKDSPGLLRTWLNHHLALFDASSITVIDHSSQSQDVKDQLTAFSGLGGNVHVFHGSFSEKGPELSRIMKARAPYCDFLVPIDTDELIVVHYRSNDTYATLSREAMENEFEKLRPTIDMGKTYKFGMINDAKFCSLEVCM